MSWATAHQVANIAAAQAHAALGVVPAQPPVDVEAAIRRAGIILMAQPMPRLFGVYVNEPGSRPGIMVNSQLRHAARRQTEAHELGHHRFGHPPQVDGGPFVETDENGFGGPAASRRRVWPPHEQAAEAFAAWFLMPLLGVRAAMSRLGMGSVSSPESAYQLSLVMGTPYRATLRHLPNLRLLGATRAREWAKVSPGRIKAQMDKAFEQPASRVGDVWRVQPGLDGTTVTLFEGDRLVVDARWSLTGLPPGISPVAESLQSRGHTDVRVYECGPLLDRGSLAFVDHLKRRCEIRVAVGVNWRGLGFKEGC